MHERLQLREELLNLLSTGASIEVGPLSPVLQTNYARRLTHGKLRELLGNEDVDWMLSVVEPTSCCKLTITDRGPDPPGVDLFESS
jgi:hypothetical protein